MAESIFLQLAKAILDPTYQAQKLSELINQATTEIKRIQNDKLIKQASKDIVAGRESDIVKIPTKEIIDKQATTPQTQTQQVQTDMFPLSEEYKPFLKSTYNSYKDLKPGYLESLIMTESTMGQNKKNELKDYGKFGYLVGLTQTAANELIRNKISFDANSVQGAIDAAAKYSDLKRTVYDYDQKTDKQTVRYIYEDMPKLWKERYNTRKGIGDEDTFRKYYDYYSTLKY